MAMELVNGGVMIIKRGKKSSVNYLTKGEEMK